MAERLVHADWGDEEGEFSLHGWSGDGFDAVFNGRIGDFHRSALGTALFQRHRFGTVASLARHLPPRAATLDVGEENSLAGFNALVGLRADVTTFLVLEALGGRLDWAAVDLTALGAQA